MGAHFDNDPLQLPTLSTHPIAAAMGAEVRGVDLCEVTDEQFADVERALYHHGLLVFRGQHLTHAAQERFTERFGEHGTDAYTSGVPGHPNIQPVIREPGPELPIFFGANWHTDSPFLERPPAISMLRSVQTPPYGGDTLYASSRIAYERLSPAYRRLLDGLQGLYTRSHLVRARQIWEADPSVPFDLVAIEADLAAATRHPLVRTHPKTGAKSLFVDVNYTLGIEGFTRAEATPILRHLVEHITQPSFCCRIRWEADMLALWDNRLVLHQAFDDYGDHRREMYRSTVLGEVPA